MSLKNRRVLVVEDCPDQQRLLLTVLQSVGAVVELECNGAAAADTVRRNHRESRHPFHAVIMDLFLDKDDGISATRQIKVIDPLLPIIAITAHGSPGIELEWKSAGCTAYLEKPLEHKLLIEHLVNAIRESERDWLFQVQVQQMVEERETPRALPPFARAQEPGTSCQPTK